MITETDIDQLSRRFRDPGIALALMPREDWSIQRHEHEITITHRSGAYVLHRTEGASWWPRVPAPVVCAGDLPTRQLRGPRGGLRDFRYPSRAIAALQGGGHLEARPTEEGNP